MKKYLLLAILGLFFIQEAFGLIPVIRVRFANPDYIPSTGKYHVDVEFQSNTTGTELFGMNVRFIYDDALLEFVTIGDLQGGYRASGQPAKQTGSPSSSSLFGFTGPMEYINTTVQLVITGNPIVLSTTGWTKLFNMSFTIDDPTVFSPETSFCPSLVWDLEPDPVNGSFFSGSQGVIMTAVDPQNTTKTIPVSEQVDQFNWTYDGTLPNPPWGAPVKLSCIQVPNNCPIELRTGWNIISACLAPPDPDLIAIFQSLINEGKLLKVQDESGNSCEDMGFLGGWTNNIGNLLLTEGYKVKVSGDCLLTISGTPVTLPFDIPLKTGWNIIGFPRTSEVNAMVVIQQLIDHGTLIKVQDELGNAIEDLGFFGGWENGIGNFKPGEGYKIKVISNDILTIN